MTELMQILYDYASSYRLAGSMADCEQFNESEKLAKSSLKDLQEALNEQELKKLQNYLGEQQILQDLEREAIFRAGFSIGLELSRV